ncbi:hypothetical protein I3843_09G025300 [Carya illinoinensis]|uniref:uncharacterized protein LOC122275365 isoform X2 n=1 Tax=Carya illinoinensis TaxID=32201 RepID=UPI001C725885|nr:uncharacterized protein LOC122275365 isoform X2 [Carya illinoinensis]KAG7961615.1 hypothetical protein I3843_09G025300 [Carya illinoinensis]
MEEGIRSLSRSLASFCNHLESSCYALKQSLDRRPIPLDSVSSSFIKSLNRRVSGASGDLNVLDSMILGTVSFEELLGHCNEVYKKNQSDLSELQDRLKSLGYHVPDVEISDEEEVPDLSTTLCLESKEGLAPPSSYFGQDCTTGSIIKSLEEDALLDESLSLKKLGLSDACLATLASGANGQIESEDSEHGKRTICDVNQKSNEAPKPLIKISIDDYESLPSYMKGLALWELLSKVDQLCPLAFIPTQLNDHLFKPAFGGIKRATVHDLLEAVEKINSSLSKKQRTKGSNYFHQDEISSLGLGPKARSYLLLLVRMNRLVVETIDGLISYRVL